MIAGRIGGHVQFGPVRAIMAADVMPGRHAIGVQFARRLQQVAELHPFIAANAGHGCGAGQIGIGEFLDHGFAELVFVIKYIMRESHPLGNAAGVVNVLTGAAGALFGQRRTVIVKLQRDADHVISLRRQHRRHNRTVDAARHGDNHACLRRRLAKPQRIHWHILRRLAQIDFGHCHGSSFRGPRRAAAFHDIYRKKSPILKGRGGILG